MMLILRASDSKGKGDRVVFTLQPRVPVPSMRMPELPAGMLDGSGNFSGTAAKEIEEETGACLPLSPDTLIEKHTLIKSNAQD
jgi:ADP-sugar diphosphatase